MNKNIFLLPTDKPSRLYKHDELGFKLLAPVGHEIGQYNGSNQHIYITSDKEIKEGDWYYIPRTNSVYKCNEDPTELNLERRLGVAKIILTTDQDLIKDGVQAIPDEFLDWFCSKNGEVDFVEVITIEDEKN